MDKTPLLGMSAPISKTHPSSTIADTMRLTPVAIAVAPTTAQSVKIKSRRNHPHRTQGIAPIQAVDDSQDSVERKKTGKIEGGHYQYQDPVTTSRKWAKII